MIKNYLKIAWRNLWKNKGYTTLNILGLAIGITCAGLILLWVEDELSYDSTFPNSENVYFIPTNQQYEGEWRTFFKATPGPLAAALKEEIPEISSSSRSVGEEITFKVGENTLSKNGRFADPDFLKIFSLDFIEGNASQAFTNYDAIVLSVETTTQLFGKGTRAMGKVVRVNNDTNYTVSGVFKDLPENVTYDFDWVAPFERYMEDKPWMKEYGSKFSDTFVTLAPGADVDAVDAKVRKLIPEKTEEPGLYAFLLPMKDWHLRSNFEGGKQVGGQIAYVRLFSVVAAIILLIACINFMNLYTARSERRAAEVGLRKVLGSGKKALIIQFIAEAVITAAMASGVSIVLLLLLIPRFNILIEKHLTLDLINPAHIFALLGITISCGLLAGWYPAFYLSSFQPVKALKGIRSKKGSAAAIRKGLVIAQFTASIVFIISTIIVYQQVRHVKSRSLGFNRENLIEIPVKGDMVRNFIPIRQELIASRRVLNAGLNNSEVLSGGNNGSGLQWEGGTDTEDVLVSFRYISPGFLETAGMQIVEGRGFGDDVARDSSSILITQSFAKMMGKGSAIGKTVRRDHHTYTVAGVVRDYLYGDMYGTSDPVIFLHDFSNARYMYVRTRPGNDLDKTLALVEGVLKKYNPAFPFDYRFVDDAFDARFKSEKLLGNLSRIFALLSVVISCLGLFGLAAYTAEQRRKEIGIRKVLGSDVGGIVQLLSKDFMRLVLIALLIAGPLGWWAMHRWLQGFAYRIEINLWVFAIAGFVAVCIALITVSFQAVRAATVNPVNSLRAE